MKWQLFTGCQCCHMTPGQADVLDRFDYLVTRYELSVHVIGELAFYLITTVWCPFSSHHNGNVIRCCSFTSLPSYAMNRRKWQSYVSTCSDDPYLIEPFAQAKWATSFVLRTQRNSFIWISTSSVYAQYFLLMFRQLSVCLLHLLPSSKILHSICISFNIL